MVLNFYGASLLCATASRFSNSNSFCCATKGPSKRTQNVTETTTLLGNPFSHNISSQFFILTSYVSYIIFKRNLFSRSARLAFSIPEWLSMCSLFSAIISFKLLYSFFCIKGAIKTVVVVLVVLVLVA